MVNRLRRFMASRDLKEEKQEEDDSFRVKDS